MTEAETVEQEIRELLVQLQGTTHPEKRYEIVARIWLARKKLRLAKPAPPIK